MEQEILEKSIPKIKEPGFWSETFRFIIISLLVVIPIRLYIAQPFVVSGESMIPTFQNGEYLVVDEISYRLRSPARGEVIIFKYPADPSKYFIKRIIGLPDEKVSLNGENVSVTTTDSEEILLSEPYIEAPTFGNSVTTLGPNEYFVMGDNRSASSDSRIWGGLPKDNIVGRALLRLLPVARASVLPGQVKITE